MGARPVVSEGEVVEGFLETPPLPGSPAWVAEQEAAIRRAKSYVEDGALVPPETGAHLQSVAQPHPS